MTTRQPIDVRHQLNRIAQTPRTFANWPTLLSDMVLERVGRGPDTLSFHTRSGLRIDCPNRPGARVPVYEIFAEDCYRLDWFLGSLAGSPMHVLDIGGHVGTFACQLAQRQPAATIHCFEPSATTAEFLRCNVSQNGFSSRISVTESAVADSTGFAMFEDNGAGSGLNGLVKDGSAPASATRVPTVAFDEVVASAPSPVKFVKIDCEGGEYGLVFGSSPQSWATVDRVVLEYHPHPQHSWAELKQWFADQNLRVLSDDAVSAQQGTAWLSRNPV